jgi:argininosuccinate lyase
MDWYRKDSYYMSNNDLSNYTVSIHYDRRLYREDIAGSIVHVRMLSKQSIISEDDCKTIIQGLESIHEEIESDECGISII